MPDRQHAFVKHLGNPSKREPGSAVLDRIEAANPVAKNMPTRATAKSGDISGLPTEANIKQWAARAHANSPRCTDATKYRG